MKNLKIETFPVGTLSCNCSLIYDESSREAIVVDPGDDLNKVMELINERGLKVKSLLHTHAHFDHIGCAAGVKEKTGAKIHLHTGDYELYKNLPVQRSMFGMPSSQDVGQVDESIEDLMEYGIAGDSKLIQAFYTPGHTQGSVCFYTECLGSPILFAGDTLFRGSIGRTDLPGGDPEKIKKSIKQRLYYLPEETRVITGHGPETRIYDEKNHNPFVQG